ncbi:cyclic nucleotide-binding domain-containing protein [Parasphingopyxis marina]|uniref:Cyclic nucleotide-binding domain-containing protein n=1 Tax=Parasphingopyxis marina TaxID=2761622 RepID=A0A842HXJ9_9SPHN|nr:cyclic nucleotide-binding domain-containing protein [Parasphingopyxis marina]MBC2777061.1 cyclic nucleotide-binding domain-containing protein [Parasphingopyxis marina]
MRKALYILGDLAEEDVVFLSKAGSIVELGEGERLVRAGVPVEALYFLTAGAMDVRLANGAVVASLGVGDVIGEMSFVEKRPPDTDVIASEPCRLLAVPRDALDRELGTNPAFAGRFFKALATFLSDRLRSLTADVAGSGGGDGEIDERLLDIVHVAGDRMVRLIALMDEEHGAVG